MDPWLEEELDEIEHKNKDDTSIVTASKTRQADAAKDDKSTSEISGSVSSKATQNHGVQKTSTTGASDKVGIQTGTKAEFIVHIFSI